MEPPFKKNPTILSQICILGPDAVNVPAATNVANLRHAKAELISHVSGEECTSNEICNQNKRPSTPSSINAAHVFRLIMAGSRQL